MDYDEQISLVSLAFKRKVFFMDFSEEFTLVNLFRLYMMLLHPILQIKYRLDPHIPRFYRFMLLFTRVNLLFCLSFFLLKDLPNPSEASSSTSSLLVFIFLLGPVLFLPLPVMIIFSPFRSRYFLLRLKGSTPVAIDYEQRNPSEENDKAGDGGGSAT
jgi:hypothetical protein